MKRSVLVLLALLSLLPGAQLMAQAPQPAAAPSASSATPPAPDIARFLATLPGGNPQAPSDAPLFMTGCSSPCSRGEICCFLCGTLPADGDTSGCWGCTTPVKGRCPLVA